MLVQFLAMRTTSNAVWGAHHGAFLPAAPDVWMFIALPLLLLIPSVRNAIVDWLLQPVSATWIPRLLTALLSAATVALIGLSYPVLFAFLGDGSILLSEIHRVLTNPDAAHALAKPTSWLTGHTLHLLAQILRPTDLRDAFGALGFLAAGIVITAAWVQLRDAERPVRLILIGGILWSAATIFFLRYVELYALQYALVAGFLFALWRSLTAARSVLVPAVMLVLAILAGASALILLPAFAMLLLRDSSRRTQVAWVLVGAIPLAALVVALIATSMPGAPLAAWIMPVSDVALVSNGTPEGSNHYTVFSALHLADCVNALWLHAAPQIVGIIACLLLCGRKALTPSPLRDVSIVLLSSVLTLVLVGNTMYGMAQDWDILALTGPAFVFTLASMVHAVAGGEAGRAARRGAALAVALVVLLLPAHVWPWIRVNASETSAQRFEGLVLRYAGHVPPWNTYRSWMNLISWHSSRDEQDAVFENRLRAFETGMQGPATLQRMLEDVDLLDASQRPGACERIADALDRIWPACAHPRPVHDPDSALVRAAMASTLLRLHRDGTDAGMIERLRQRAAARFGAWPEADIIDAVVRTDIDPQRRSDMVKRAGATTVRDPMLAYLAGNLTLQAGDTTTTIACYAHVIDLAPATYPELHAGLAILLHYRHRTQEAVDVLHRGLETTRVAEHRQRMHELLDALGR